MEVTVVKIGGNIIDDPAGLSAFLKEFGALSGHRILVHGGGKIATSIGRKLGLEPNYVDGRRITDAETLELITMVYGGLINKKIVAQLQSFGCNAIGLTGADGALLPASRRPAAAVDYGFVGDIKSNDVNSYLLAQFIGTGLVPVIAPLSFDPKGSLLNTNADTIAQEIAKKLAQSMTVKLIYCFEKKGVLADADDDTSVISIITQNDFSELRKKEVITGGMIPKLENALAAINTGVKKVIIGHAGDLSGLISETAGTCIR